MASSHPSPLRIVLVGAGRVGTAVSLLLQESGHRVVGVASRSSSSATRAAKRLGAAVFALSDTPPDFDLMLIGAGDGAIETVAETVAPHATPDALFCHFAGSLGVTPLASIERNGGRVAALHPVQAIPDVDAGLRNLPGSAWGVTTSDPDTATLAIALVERDLGGAAVHVSEEDRPVWHAAAVITSNGIAALMAAGEDLLQGVRVDDAPAVLGPLAAGTVANARAGGGGAATLTGPVVRGDVSTVARHLEALRSSSSTGLDSYRRVSRLIVEGALHAGRIDRDTAERMLSLLSAP